MAASEEVEPFQMIVYKNAAVRAQYSGLSQLKSPKIENSELYQWAMS